MIKNTPVIKVGRLNEDVDYSQLTQMVEDYSTKLSMVLDQARLIADAGNSEVSTYIRRFTIPALEKIFSLSSYNGSLPQIMKLLYDQASDQKDPGVDLTRMDYPDYTEDSSQASEEES